MYKTIAVLLLLSIFLFSCSENTNDKSSTNQQNVEQSVWNKIEVLEVEQANQYSYLKVKEGEQELWMAVRKDNFEVGGIYYYDSGMEMKNFKSKDLERTFESILFVENISSKPSNPSESSTPAGGMPKPISSRESLSFETVDGGISIAQLFSERDTYSGKSVKIKGKVTKYNPNILGKNWIHIQDGTDSNGEYDLTITTNDEVKVGDIIICEGIVTLNKDFGAGYSYNVIIENASIIN
jgi:hypothetical protein